MRSDRKLKQDRKGIETLVIQLADLGDLLLAAPAIRHLRTSDPGRRLTILTKRGNKTLAGTLADEVMVVDKHVYDRPVGLLNPSAAWTLLRLGLSLRRRKFDQIMLLHHFVSPWGTLKFRLLVRAIGAPACIGLDDGRGSFLTNRVADHGFGAAGEADYWAELAGGSAKVAVTANQAAADTLLTAHDVTLPYAVLHPGSGGFSTARRWPVERFVDVAGVLHSEHGLMVIVVGGADEIHLGETIARAHPEFAVNVAGQTDLATLAGILGRAALFVGNDGGVAQLAGIMATPSIIIYGPTSPVTWKPPSSRVRSVRLDLPCSPCLYRYHELGTPEGCATRECLIDLPAALVVNQARLLLGQLRAA